MSIWRGAQSAIFFYLSCAPCMDIRYRKERQRAALFNEAERAETKTRHPDYPHQAPPGSINPFWQAEIDAGPRINKKEWKDAKEHKSRELKRAESQRQFLKTSATQSSVGSKAQSSFADASPTQRQYTSYQRQDEELWGTSSMSRMESTSTFELPSRPTTAKTTPSTHPHAYHQARHPAINDLHPPTTRKIQNRDEVAWMLQPLPTAAVMQGKEAPSRSRSNSDISRKSPKSVRQRPLTPTPLTPIKASYGSEETVIRTPGSDDVLEEAPEEWVYEQTRREVQERRSLDW